MEFQVMIVASILVCFFVKWLMNYVRKCVMLPPGPWGVPVLGYLPWMTDKPHEKFYELAKKYGAVFSVTLGSETVVVLNDWPSIKETLVDQPNIFAGRPVQPVTAAITKNKDVAFSDNPVWKEQRRLMTRCLRNIGMGKKSMESKIMNMVHEMLEELGKNDGKELHMHSFFVGPFLSFTWKLIIDDGIETDEMSTFGALATDLLKAMSAQNLVNIFPWLRFVPPNGFGYWKILRLNKKILSHLQKLIDRHRAKWNEGANHDFVDFYVAEAKAQVTPRPPYNDDEHLLMSVWNMFMAGVETSNTTCLWGMLYMAHYPDVQRKAQAEMDRVVGRHRLPTIDDFPRLTYLDAVIMEVNRFANLVPLSIPHTANKDVRVAGYTVPKGTTVVQNIFAVHHDPTLWDQHDKFNPERFLDDNNKLKNPQYCMAFSVGPRHCLGKPLAVMELRLIFSCLLHHFSFHLSPDGPKPTLEPVFHLTLEPVPYSLLIEMRKS